MGRRKRPTPVTMTTISISMETLETISRYKSKRENQTTFINRIFNEWQEDKEIIKDMEAVYSYQMKRIEQYEEEIRRLRTLVVEQQNPVIQV